MNGLRCFTLFSFTPFVLSTCRCFDMLENSKHWFCLSNSLFCLLVYICKLPNDKIQRIHKGSLSILKWGHRDKQIVMITTKYFRTIDEWKILSRIWIMLSSKDLTQKNACDFCVFELHVKRHWKTWMKYQKSVKTDGNFQ